MKSYKLLLAVLSVSIVSFMACNDIENTEENTSKCSSTLCGEWVWVSSSGTIAGITITPETEGVIKTIIIDDVIYQEFIDEELVLETEYEFSEPIMTFNSGIDKRVEMDDEDLQLHDQLFDGWSHSYRRK